VKVASSNSISPQQRALFYVLLFVCFALGYLAMQFYLADENRLNEAALKLRPPVVELCTAGIRLPGVPCEELHVALFGPREAPTLTVKFARLPNLEAVLNELQWNGNTEIEAVRFISLFNALIGSRHKEKKAHKDKQMTLLDPLWNDYADLLFASRCLYCGGIHKRLLTENIKAAETVPDSVLRGMVASPVLMPMAIDKGWIDVEHGEQLKRLQGELLFTSYSSASQKIGTLFDTDEDYDRLMHYTLRVGTAPLLGLNLLKVPRALVKIAWQRDIERGEANLSLTEYLLKTGYRPALRWSLWSEADSFPYLITRGHGTSQASYLGMIRQHTEFPQLRGEALTRYYSENWQRITWNPETGKWQTGAE
jgi:hypothetical protein